ncbi:VWA domain-containing protein [Danxiaibacter flavus]|uniref:VWA domain-containing protein n=1 Tax=Danxiaibacter flavus TaxID=3049108 RepID=A0ABV3ZBR3_9BACT|nr:VWA domain-containing protein [Chitinophagaceae bacterium DXS]
MFDDIKNIITHIDWQQFHFLRPLILWLFLPLAAIVLLLVLSNKEKSKWKMAVQKKLRPFMFTRGSKTAIILPLLAFVFGSSFVIVGAAGPTWKKKDIPGEKIQAVVLIALNLSRSMDATDIQPSRLQRAKFKVSDFLDANPRARAGLVAYAGTAHPVLPFTSDYKLIKHHAQSLENRVMPVQGTNMEVLINVIDTLMRGVLAPSTVLLMTDEIDQDDATLITNYVRGSIHKIEILLFNTPAGASVPGHRGAVSKQDAGVIQNLSQDTSIHITPLTLDKSDVSGIAKRIGDKLVFEKDTKQDDKDWDDMGWLLVIPALVITAFWFRRGWVIQWCWLGLICVTFSSCGVDSKEADWWYTKDYQGQKLYNQGKYAEAAERFADDKHKAVAYFKAGNYSAAADLFELDTSAAGNYNRGLALAKLGRYDEAVAAFDKAIDLDGSLKDRASKNIVRAKQQIDKIDSVNRFTKNDIGKGKTLKENKKKKEPYKEEKHNPQEGSLSNETQVKQLPHSGERSTETVATNIRKAKESETPGKNMQHDKHESLSNNILLRKASADPAEFLHKRFVLQEKRYYKHVSKSKHPW